MSVAFIFPGQGPQYPGMLNDLIDHPAVEHTLEEVSHILQEDVRTLDTREALRSDVSIQLALFTAGVASARAVMQQRVCPIAVSGHSIGAFAAAVIAGVLQVCDGVELVRLRALGMEKLFPSGYGLAAIIGLSEAEVARIVQAETSEAAPVYVGNINAPRQIVIAGANTAMSRVLAEAQRRGATRTVSLPVPVPSHCPLLRPVAETLAGRISRMQLSAPQLIYVGNITARALRTKEQISWDLANNVAHGVRWHDATTVLKELGSRLFLEMPPGHTLTELALHNLDGVEALAITPAALPRILRLGQREQKNT